MTMGGTSDGRLSRLLYTSRCAIEGSENDRRREVRAIAGQSFHHNRRLGLTGSLLFVEDSFVQVLEGPPDRLEQVFEAICCDFRHDDVRLIDLTSVSERLFPDWGMAFLSGDGDAPMARHQDLQGIRFLVGVNAREAVSQMRDLLDCVPA